MNCASRERNTPESNFPSRSALGRLETRIASPLPEATPMTGEFHA